MLFTVDHTPVFPIALGGAGIGSHEKQVFFGKVVNDRQAVDTVLYALSHGVNLLDTSPFYGNSEKKMGLAIREFGNRNSFVLSTKAGTHPQYKGYTADLFKRSIESSLKTLGTDYLDIVHIHDPSETDFAKVMDANGGLETLLRLRQEGVIRHVGLGVRNHALHRAFMASGFADILLPYLDYNLLKTSASHLLDEARQKNVPVLMGSPLCMGLLSGRPPLNMAISHYDVTGDVSVNKAHDMYLWCKEKGANIQALNFEFILRQPMISALITGASSAEEIAENINAYHCTCAPEITESFFTHFQIETPFIQ